MEVPRGTRNDAKYCNGRQNQSTCAAGARSMQREQGTHLTVGHNLRLIPLYTTGGGQEGPGTEGEL